MLVTEELYKAIIEGILSYYYMRNNMDKLKLKVKKMFMKLFL